MMFKVVAFSVVLLLCFHKTLGVRMSFDNGNFDASWSYSQDFDELYFEVNAKTSGWVGFGFTFTPENMSNYDVVIGGQTDWGQSYFYDYLTSGVGIPHLDSKQSYILDKATEQHGITSLRFRRKRNTNDSQDIQFNISTRVFIVWAYQEVDDVNNPRMFSMHIRKGYSEETQILAIEASEPTFSTKKFVKTEPGNTSRFEMTTKLLRAKSSGFKQRFNVITLSFVTITLYFLLALQFAC